MRPTTVPVGPLVAASGNNIALSQTPTAAFTLNGSTVASGVATLDTPRRVLFTPAGNESANNFTLVGTGLNGTPQTEVVRGTNATPFFTNLDFLTVSLITLSSAAAGAITVGTNGVASSQWVRFDEYASAQVSLQASISGTVNYTVQQTLQDPNSITSPIIPYNVIWVNSADAAAVGASTSIVSQFVAAPIYARVTLNSGSGSVSTVFTQFGVAPY
jgi:hypothetical protein